MMRKSKIGKILFVVIIFLSSVQVVNAGTPFSTINTNDALSINEKPTLNNAKIEVKTDRAPSVGFTKVNPDVATNNLISLPELESISIYHERYAVIIVGGYTSGGDTPPQESYKWFTLSVRNMYDILTNSIYNYNFNPDHIFILLTFMYDPVFQENLSFDPNIISVYADSTEDNIKEVFNKFKTGGDSELDANDLLLVEVIAHGMDSGWYYGGYQLGLPFDWWPNGHDTYFGLEEADTDGDDYVNCPVSIGESSDPVYYNNASAFSPQTKIKDWELASYTSGIHAKRTIFILQPCCSGGFINDLSREDRVIITASRENEIAGDFLGPFERALKGEQYAVGADRNNDGKISLEEIFYYAGSQVPRPGETIVYHPLIDDNGDGAGHGYNDYCSDSYVAAGVYYFKYEKIINNHYPAKPQTPWEAFGNGSIVLYVIADQEYLFSTVTTDPDGDQLFYNWSWGDSEHSGWLGPSNSGFNSDGSHIWNQLWIFNVKVKAKDTHGYESDWSEPLTVVVLPGIFNELPQAIQNNVLTNLESELQRNLVTNSKSATLLD